MPNELAALDALGRIAAEHGLRVVLIGALAREIVFDDVHGVPLHRRTRDVDTGVRVSGWDQYERLARDLQARGGFVRADRHLFRYRDGTELDLLPFGGVADAEGNLDWGPAPRIHSLHGLATADEHASSISRLGATVRIANLPSLVALKLFAFHDRRAETPKDLADLNHVLTYASDALEERIFDELAHELEVLGFDSAGSFLLGRDVAAIAPAPERARLDEILQDAILDPPEYANLVRVLRGSEVALNEAVERFEAFGRGLRAPSSDPL